MSARGALGDPSGVCGPPHGRTPNVANHAWAIVQRRRRSPAVVKPGASRYRQGSERDREPAVLTRMGSEAGPSVVR